MGGVEDEDEGDGIEFGQVFFEGEEVGAAFEARAFAEFGQDDFQDAGGGKRGWVMSRGRKRFGSRPVIKFLSTLLLPEP